jgi:hypothetical protein
MNGSMGVHVNAVWTPDPKMPTRHDIAIFRATASSSDDKLNSLLSHRQKYLVDLIYR